MTIKKTHFFSTIWQKLKPDEQDMVDEILARSNEDTHEKEYEIKLTYWEKIVKEKLKKSVVVQW